MFVFVFPPAAVKVSDQSGKMQEAVGVGEEKQTDGRKEERGCGDVESHVGPTLGHALSNFDCGVSSSAGKIAFISGLWKEEACAMGKGAL